LFTPPPECYISYVYVWYIYPPPPQTPQPSAHLALISTNAIYHFKVEGVNRRITRGATEGGEQVQCAPARLRQPEPRMRLAVRGVPTGALRTHSA